jgi:hypothetical protein
VIAVAALALVACAPLGADYLRDVKPVLRERCSACHGALKQEAGLRLDTAAAVRTGGDSGPAAVPGKPDDSAIIERVTADEGNRMPPEGKPLTAAQVAALKAWVAAGAQGPPDEKPEADPRRHWAFVKPVSAPVPAVPGADNPVDAFLAAEWGKRGLTPAGPADRATLLRRVTLDLTGLPPTPEQLHAFENDQRPDAYEHVVDRLLASPAYGERWARHWMDVWRYSDWYGRRSVPDVLNSYGMVWRWRDWIVRSLNADAPYDRMVQEMLAADELAPGDDEKAVATAFLVRNFFRWNYNQWMRDNVEHTAKAFLGLTFNCCQCHDHKYDPLTQEEYFKLRAVFEPLEIRHERVPGEPDPGPYPKYKYGSAYKPITSGAVRVFDEQPDAETFMYVRGDERVRMAGRPPVPPGVPAALGGAAFRVEPVALPPASYYPGTKPFVRAEETARRATAVAAAEAAVPAARDTLARAFAPLADRRVLGDPAARAKAIAALEDARLSLPLREAELAAARAEQESLAARIAADDVKYLGRPGNVAAVSRAAARAEKLAARAAARVQAAQAELALAAARRTAATGDAKAKAALTAAEAKAKQTATVAATPPPADPGTDYTPLSPVYPPHSSGRRLALARWITGPDNPLTARVAVNHVWNWHFGRPIVESTADFGRNGKAPTHPELLDWLACRLVADGWRFKPLHRLLVTSRAYRMASLHPSPDGNKTIDPDGRYLWRYPSQRLDAELVRDGLLAAAGDLDRAPFGPEVAQDQGLTVPRRSLYFSHHGETRMPFLDLFDAANPCDCYRRAQSVLPQQALALGNSDLALRLARRLAARLTMRDEAGFVTAAFERVLGRAPTEPERAACSAFLSRQTRLFRASPPPAVKATLPGDAPATDPTLRARENLVHALFNHGDFVTVR